MSARLLQFPERRQTHHLPPPPASPSIVSISPRASAIIDRALQARPTGARRPKPTHPTDEQARAIKALVAWYRDPRRKVFRLFGFAGTGKSTVAEWAIAALRASSFCRKVVTCTPTNLAAEVLRGKGISSAMTCHRALYVPNEEEGGDVSFTLAEDGPAAEADLVVIDEGAMVGTTMGRDFMKVARKILVLYDDGQLRPVGEPPYFTDVDPDVRLTEISRQSMESPIVRLSMEFRNGRMPPFGDYGDGVFVLPLNKVTQQLVYRESHFALCGMHRVRWTYTQRIRRLREQEGDMPNVGEPILSRKNHHEDGIYNGSPAVLTDTPFWSERSPGLLEIQYRMAGEEKVRKGRTHPYLFEQHRTLTRERPAKIGRAVQEWDWDYLRTVHSAQGSEWPAVTVIDDADVFRGEAWKHRYTGFTRASECVTFLARE